MKEINKTITKINKVRCQLNEVESQYKEVTSNREYNELEDKKANLLIDLKLLAEELVIQTKVRLY